MKKILFLLLLFTSSCFAALPSEAEPINVFDKAYEQLKSSEDWSEGTNGAGSLYTYVEVCFRRGEVYNAEGIAKKIGLEEKKVHFCHPSMNSSDVAGRLCSKYMFSEENFESSGSTITVKKDAAGLIGAVTNGTDYFFGFEKVKEQCYPSRLSYSSPLITWSILSLIIIIGLTIIGIYAISKKQRKDYNRIIHILIIVGGVLLFFLFVLFLLSFMAA